MTINPGYQGPNRGEDYASHPLTVKKTTPERNDYVVELRSKGSATTWKVTIEKASFLGKDGERAFVSKAIEKTLVQEALWNYFKDNAILDPNHDFTGFSETTLEKAKLQLKFSYIKQTNLRAVSLPKENREAFNTNLRMADTHISNLLRVKAKEIRDEPGQLRWFRHVQTDPPIKEFLKNSYKDHLTLLSSQKTKIEKEIKAHKEQIETHKKQLEFSKKYKADSQDPIREQTLSLSKELLKQEYEILTILTEQLLDIEADLNLHQVKHDYIDKDPKSYNSEDTDLGLSKENLIRLEDYGARRAIKETALKEIEQDKSDTLKIEKRKNPPLSKEEEIEKLSRPIPETRIRNTLEEAFTKVEGTTASTIKDLEIMSEAFEKIKGYSSGRIQTAPLLIPHKLSLTSLESRKQNNRRELENQLAQIKQSIPHPEEAEIWIKKRDRVNLAKNVESFNDAINENPPNLRNATAIVNKLKTELGLAFHAGIIEKNLKSLSPGYEKNEKENEKDFRALTPQELLKIKQETSLLIKKNVEDALNLQYDKNAINRYLSHQKKLESLEEFSPCISKERSQEDLRTFMEFIELHKNLTGDQRAATKELLEKEIDRMSRLYFISDKNREKLLESISDKPRKELLENESFLQENEIRPFLDKQLKDGLSGKNLILKLQQAKHDDTIIKNDNAIKKFDILLRDVIKKYGLTEEETRIFIQEFEKDTTLLRDVIKKYGLTEEETRIFIQEFEKDTTLLQDVIKKYELTEEEARIFIQKFNKKDNTLIHLSQGTVGLCIRRAHEDPLRGLKKFFTDSFINDTDSLIYNKEALFKKIDAFKKAGILNKKTAILLKDKIEQSKDGAETLELFKSGISSSFENIKSESGWITKIARYFNPLSSESKPIRLKNSIKKLLTKKVKYNFISQFFLKEKLPSTKSLKQANHSKWRKTGIFQITPKIGYEALSLDKPLSIKSNSTLTANQFIAAEERTESITKFIQLIANEQNKRNEQAIAQILTSDKPAPSNKKFIDEVEDKYASEENIPSTIKNELSLMKEKYDLFEEDYKELLTQVETLFQDPSKTEAELNKGLEQLQKNLSTLIKWNQEKTIAEKTPFQINVTKPLTDKTINSVIKKAIFGETISLKRPEREIEMTSISIKRPQTELESTSIPNFETLIEEAIGKESSEISERALTKLNNYFSSNSIDQGIETIVNMIKSPNELSKAAKILHFLNYTKIKHNQIPDKILVQLNNSESLDLIEQMLQLQAPQEKWDSFFRQSTSMITGFISSFQKITINKSPWGTKLEALLQKNDKDLHTLLEKNSKELGAFLSKNNIQYKADDTFLSKLEILYKYEKEFPEEIKKFTKILNHTLEDQANNFLKELVRLTNDDDFPKDIIKFTQIWKEVVKDKVENLTLSSIEKEAEIEKHSNMQFFLRCINPKIATPNNKLLTKLAAKIQSIVNTPPESLKETLKTINRNLTTIKKSLNESEEKLSREVINPKSNVPLTSLSSRIKPPQPSYPRPTNNIIERSQADEKMHSERINEIQANQITSLNTIEDIQAFLEKRDPTYKKSPLYQKNIVQKQFVFSDKSIVIKDTEDFIQTEEVGMNPHNQLVKDLHTLKTILDQIPKTENPNFINPFLEVGFGVDSEELNFFITLQTHGINLQEPINSEWLKEGINKTDLLIKNEKLKLLKSINQLKKSNSEKEYNEKLSQLSKNLHKKLHIQVNQKEYEKSIAKEFPFSEKEKLDSLKEEVTQDYLKPLKNKLDKITLEDDEFPITLPFEERLKVYKQIQSIFPKIEKELKEATSIKNQIQKEIDQLQEEAETSIRLYSKAENPKPKELIDDLRNTSSKLKEEFPKLNEKLLSNNIKLHELDVQRLEIAKLTSALMLKTNKNIARVSILSNINETQKIYELTQEIEKILEDQPSKK